MSTPAPTVAGPGVAGAAVDVVVGYVRGLRAGLRRELRDLRRSPDQLMALVTAPLLTLAFLAIMLNAGRRDLAPFAVLAPALLVLWQMALHSSADTVESERENGSLEALVATPAPLSAVIGGRIAAVTAVSLLGFAESWVVAGVVFGLWVPVYHPGVLLLTVVATGYATAGSAVVLAALYVMTRSARTLQNALSYPFYILGGVIVPVALLPAWLQPLTAFVFLSWSSDLMRDSLAPVAVPMPWARLGMVVLLGTVALVCGAHLIRRALDRVRSTGAIGHA